MKVKLLHTADIHLGVTTYGRLDPETGINSRLADFERSFRFMTERALAEDIDLFLFCGDAYRTADPSPTQQKIFADCLKPVADAGIPIVMIVGNHDHPIAFGKASAIDIFGYLTGRVYVYTKASFAVIPTKSGPVQLIALPWPVKSMLLAREEYRGVEMSVVRERIEEAYARFVQEAARKLDPNLPAVLAAHLTVRGAEMSGSESTSKIEDEATFGVSQLALPGIDYVALGHIHRYQNRNEGGIPVVYSSSLERISFREKDDRKGFVLVEVEVEEGRKNTTFEFVDTPARPYVEIFVDAREAEDPTAHILAAIQRSEIAGAVVRVQYRIGEAQLPLIDAARLREALHAADHIAGVDRNVDPVVRQRRTMINRETSLEEAMRQYVAQHDHLAPLADTLVQAALKLEAEYEQQRRAAPTGA